MTSTKPSSSSHSPIKQPNSRSCFVCGIENTYGLGMKFYELGPGEVSADYVVPAQYQGYPGVVHGGIIASMLDEVASRAAMTGENTKFRYTAKLEIRYRKPIPTETTLHMRGWVTQERGSRAQAKAEIRLEDGTLLSEADALLASYPGDVGEDELEALGWRVYPD